MTNFLKMKINVLLILMQLIAICWSDNKSANRKNGNSGEKFDYLRKEPGNELGIFTKVIAHVFRKANQTTEEYRINRAYLPNDVHDGLMARCKSDAEDTSFRWHGCISDKEGLFAYVTWGIPETKNKTVTYLEVEFKPFSRVNDEGLKEICIVEELYSSRAYVCLNTFSELPSNDTFPRGVVESVANVHQHQLDEFGKHFLDIFGDKIDRSDIYNFGKDEYFDRDPPYECLLSIASSESKTVIEEKCDIYCQDASKVSRAEMEDVLIRAKKVAQELERKERERSKLEKEKHDEL